MKFYVQNTITDEEIKFSSLKKAVEHCVALKDMNTLIHIGGYNLDYYIAGDTFDTLYARCKEILDTIKKERLI